MFTTVGKVIHQKIYKQVIFSHATKWCMHELESVLENETHKLLWDFKIQMEHLFPTRRPGE